MTFWCWIIVFSHRWLVLEKNSLPLSFLNQNWWLMGILKPKLKYSRLLPFFLIHKKTVKIKVQLYAEGQMQVAKKNIFQVNEQTKRRSFDTYLALFLKKIRFSVHLTFLFVMSAVKYWDWTWSIFMLFSTR